MTPFQQHCDRWRDGCGSSQCARAKNVCLLRGQTPCDVLMVGEGPGESEDVLGAPFIGPAGKLLDGIIAEVWDILGSAQDSGGFDPQGSPIDVWAPCDLRCALTNIVGCVPRDDLTGTMKATEPDLEQIEACRPRLIEIIAICKPRLIVAVGGIANKHIPHAVMANSKTTMYAGGRVDGHPTIKRWASIVHPAHILKSVPAQRGLLRKRAVVGLAAAVESLL